MVPVVPIMTGMAFIFAFHSAVLLLLLLVVVVVIVVVYSFVEFYLGASYGHAFMDHRLCLSTALDLSFCTFILSR